MKVMLPSTLGRMAIDDWEFPPHIQALQRAIIDLIHDPKQHRLVVEMPVRHGKSFFCSYLLPAWYMMSYPKRQVMVVSYGSDFATEWSSRIRDLINEWGHLTGVALDPDFQTKSHFRLKYPHIGELRGLGIGGSLAGKGAHLIICDDLVKEFGEVVTEENRDKLYRQFHGELLTRLEPGGKVVMVMSRRHPDDLSGRLLESNKELEPDHKWRRITFKALSDDGVALWPARYNAEILRSIKRDHELAGTPWVWESLYQQDPAAASELLEWPYEYWKNLYYDILPDFKPRFRLMSLDPSMGKDRKKGDFSALLCGLVDPQGGLWLDLVHMLRIPTEALEDQSVATCKEFKPHAFAIETNMFQEVIAKNIYAKATKAKVPCPGYGINSSEDKEVRIRMGLTPLLSQGKIRVKDTPHGRMLGAQLRDFPLGSHDDGPDSLALMVRVWRMLIGGGVSGGDTRVWTV